MIDAETITLDWLEATFEKLQTTPTKRFVDTETPPSLDFLAADECFVRVTLVTGREVVTAGLGGDAANEYPLLDIDVLSKSRDTSYVWASDIRSRFAGRSHRVGSVVIDGVRTEEIPRRLPWADENIVRFGATYRISARR